MNALTLEERKKQFIDQLKLKYAPDKTKWWQSPASKFYESNEVLKNEKIRSHSDEVLFMSSVGIGLFGLFITIVSSFILILFYAEASAKLIWVIVISLVWLFGVLLMIKGFKSEPLMLVNKAGFENLRSRVFYNWETVVALYLEDTLGEDASYYLHIYYYSSTADDFLYEVIKLNEYGDRAEAIIAYLEWFRQKSGYSQAT